MEMQSTGNLTWTEIVETLHGNSVLIFQSLEVATETNGFENGVRNVEKSTGKNIIVYCDG